ncbi:MAG: hypothetical protein ACD_14C00054G0004 [uncultured bacterium]|nr:MAG: hypothetical protein ACD_14C00054G0004 [uncultured bacterium]KKQ46066.1 MAG: Hydrogenase expression/formation protein [Candidatus Moranbacteria bacterium GW2011_GWC2_37_8]KKQ62759.1 MAG: Hydrogenase expression/formation protein [Parcubacteria group bacterium GW2011_GWC1_38_22]
MCLTIPKKVIEIKENFIVVEDHNGDRQELKTLIKSLKVGDFVLVQQNIIFEKQDKEISQEIFDMINTKGE